MHNPSAHRGVDKRGMLPLLALAAAGQAPSPPPVRPLIDADANGAVDGARTSGQCIVSVTQEECQTLAANAAMSFGTTTSPTVPPGCYTHPTGYFFNLETTSPSQCTISTQCICALGPRVSAHTQTAQTPPVC